MLLFCTGSAVLSIQCLKLANVSKKMSFSWLERWVILPRSFARFNFAVVLLCSCTSMHVSCLCIFCTKRKVFFLIRRTSPAERGGAHLALSCIFLLLASVPFFSGLLPPPASPPEWSCYHSWPLCEICRQPKRLHTRPRNTPGYPFEESGRDCLIPWCW